VTLVRKRRKKSWLQGCQSEFEKDEEKEYDAARIREKSTVSAQRTRKFNILNQRVPEPEVLSNGILPVATRREELRINRPELILIE
jgi:hypothetical protein